MRSSVEAIKVGIGGFVLPFMIAFFPLLMWEPTDPFFAAAGLLACVGTLIVLQAGFVGYLMTELNAMERVLFILCGIGLLGYLYTRSLTVLAVTMVLIILKSILQVIKSRMTNPAGQTEVAMTPEI